MKTAIIPIVIAVLLIGSSTLWAGSFHVPSGPYAIEPGEILDIKIMFDWADDAGLNWWDAPSGPYVIRPGEILDIEIMFDWADDADLNQWDPTGPYVSGVTGFIVPDDGGDDLFVHH